MGSGMIEDRCLVVPRGLQEWAHATLLINHIMLKTLLLKYPLSLDEVDQLIIYMIYFNIDTIEELVAKSDEDLAVNGEWTQRVISFIQIVKDNHPLK